MRIDTAQTRATGRAAGCVTGDTAGPREGEGALGPVQGAAEPRGSLARPSVLLVASCKLG